VNKTENKTEKLSDGELDALIKRAIKKVKKVKKEEEVRKKSFWVIGTKNCSKSR